MDIQTMLSTQRPVALVSVLMLSVWALVFLYTATDKSISDFSDSIEARFKRIRPYKVAFTKWTIRPTVLNDDSGLWFGGDALGYFEATASLSDEELRRRREKMFRKFDKIHEKEINEKIKARRKEMFARFDELHKTQEAKQEEQTDDLQNGITGVDLSKQTPRQLTTAAQMVLQRAEENDLKPLQKESENKPIAVNGTNRSGADKFTKNMNHRRKNTFKAKDSRRKVTGDRKEREGQINDGNMEQKEFKYRKKEVNTKKNGESKRSGSSLQNDKRRVTGANEGVKINQNKGKKPQQMLRTRKNLIAHEENIDNKVIRSRSVINAGNVKNIVNKNKETKEDSKEASIVNNDHKKTSEEQSNASQSDKEQRKENDENAKIEPEEEDEKGIINKTNQTDKKPIVDETVQRGIKRDTKHIVHETMETDDRKDTRHIVEITRQIDNSKGRKSIVDKKKKSIVEHLAKQSETSKGNTLKEEIDDSNHRRNKSDEDVFNEIDAPEHAQSKYKRGKVRKAKKHESGKSFYARYKKEQQSSAKRTSR